jgi:hypothetical protein
MAADPADALQLIRVEDWPARLAVFVESRRHRGFQWGQHDCCMFAADWVREACGCDLVPHLRGRYHDADGARLLAGEHGVASAGDPFGALGWPCVFGLPRIPEASAGRGDLMAYPTRGILTLGICLGPVIAAPGQSGLCYHVRDRAVAAWRV